METLLSFIKEFYGLIIAFIGSGAAGGWFLKTLDYNRDKKKSKAHLKAKLLDEILDQCRRLEEILSNYPDFIKIYRKILNAEESDPETELPSDLLNLQKKQTYVQYIKGVKTEKNRLRHFHQNYIIKTKSDELQVLNVIDESLTKMIKYDDSPDFDYTTATMEYLEVYTNLRMIHHQIKEIYPEEVPLN